MIDNDAVNKVSPDFSHAQQIIVKNAINFLDASLESEFMLVMEYLHSNKSAAPKFRGKKPPIFPSVEYIEKSAEKFVNGRKVPAINWSTKITDPLLPLALKIFLDLSEEEIEKSIEIHKKLMLIENKVGEILESYISEKYSSKGWVWCSGSTVTTIDFIRKKNDGTFEILQIKDKDVSENSTSTKGRGGIPVWQRLKGKKATNNWDNFPENSTAKIMSEKEFIEYAEKKFLEIKKLQGL